MVHAETIHDVADETLAARVQVGEWEAFGELARRYLRPVHVVAASFLAEPADVEDAAQDTFLRALDRIRSYDPARPFAPWLYQIARNVARNRIRARRRWRTSRFGKRRGGGTRLPAPGDDARPGAPERRRARLRADPRG